MFDGDFNTDPNSLYWSAHGNSEDPVELHKCHISALWGRCYQVGVFMIIPTTQDGPLYIKQKC